MLEQRYFVRRDACVVCGSAALTQIYSCPMDASPVHDFIQSHYRAQGVVDWTVLAGAKFDVMECDGCGLVFQRLAPTSEMLGIVYTQMIGQPFLTEAENDLLTIGNFQEVAGELAVLFSMAGKAPKDITFLDYGFGHGRWARVARAMGATVYATEIGEDKQRLGASLGVTMIDDAEIDAMQFDIVHTEQVLEHLVEPAQQFKRLARATRGVMKVAVPRPRRLKALLQGRGMATESPFDRALRGLPRRRRGLCRHRAVGASERLHAQEHGHSGRRQRHEDRQQGQASDDLAGSEFGLPLPPFGRQGGPDDGQDDQAA